MQYSSRLPIATHILLCIAVFDGQYKTTSGFLAGSVGVNPVIVRNTLGQLKAAGLVSVEPGVGGASLSKELRDITLLDVFRAVEEPETLFHLHEHPNPNCPVGRNIETVLGERLRTVDEAVAAKLAAVTLQSLFAETKERIAEQSA